MAGCVNWLLVGLLQYDFVAGIFGYQGSVFSRIIYIIIGAGAIFFLFKVLTEKGKIEIFNFKKNSSKRKRLSEAREIEASHEYHRHHYHGYENDDGRNEHNIESSRERNYYNDYGENSLENRHSHKDYDNLFDEHFSNDN
jgi:uncharacterized membrane protein YuzA (DUF378 family)